MAEMNDNVRFEYGTKDRYNALSTKNSNTIYFITDTLEIFKGTNEYTKGCKLVSSLPSVGQLQGVVYIRTTDFTAHVYNGTEFIQITKGIVEKIPDTGASNDNTPTTKAVADYVDAKVNNVMGVQGKFVTDVTYSDGVLSVSKNGEAVPTTLTGVVHAPTYDADTRTIKLPVFGGDELSISLGKDLVVKSGIYNAVSKNIELTITSGDVIKIPVGSLIDIYTGLATASATVSVSNDNKISVSVRVSAKANNSITIEEDGLYVAVPDAYTKAETDEKVKAVKDAISGHESNAGIHVTKAQKTSWDAKVSSDQLNTAKSEVLSAASDDATKKATAALTSAKSYADNLNTAMDTRVKVVESSITWKKL